MLCARDSDRDTFPDISLNCTLLTCIKVNNIVLVVLISLNIMYVGSMSFHCNY